MPDQPTTDTDLGPAIGPSPSCGAPNHAGLGLEAAAGATMEPGPSAAVSPAASKSHLKLKIFAAIAEHIRTHGRKHWDLVREDPEFAHVIGKAAGGSGKRKFWRYVDAVSEIPPPDKTKPHEARAIATDALSQATERARLAAQQNLPAAPSPAYMMRAGAQASENLDFFREIPRMWADIERLRLQAMGSDEESPDGNSIDDPKMFDVSIRRRIELMESALRVMQEMWDVQQQQRLYDAITEIIVGELAAVPDIQQRVVAKLVELNKNRGMTIFAGAR